MKIMLLTDSNGNPRSFPASENFKMEETYPYLLRERFKDSTFWQLSFGNISTMQLISQPMAYLSHWDPDVIIVHSGIVDCRPEAFSEFQKAIIDKMSGPFFGKIKRFVYNPKWIKRRQVNRVSKKSFKRTLKKLKLVFPKAKIIWLGICAGSGYEDSRPGVTQRMDEYNDIIKEVYGDGFVSLQKLMEDINGFNAADFLHWNKQGHRAVAEILIERIASIKEGVLVES